MRSVTGFGASSVCSAIRSVAPGSNKYSKHSRLHTNKTPFSSQGSGRVVRQAMVCAGSLRVRTCKVLWKPAALQLTVTTTTCLSEDEPHFDFVDDDSDEESEDLDNDIEKLTTMGRPNKTHHYALVFCQRSLMGSARRERIELNNPRDPVEFIWGEEGMLSTRFEFSILYGAWPSGRRRTLTCRARDATEYLMWTGALRMAAERHDKKHTRLSHARTLGSSKAQSNNRESSDFFFDQDVVEKQQQQFEREVTGQLTPTSPTAATAAMAVAPPDADVAKASALKPVPIDIAGVYSVPKISRRREVSVVVKRNDRSAKAPLQRRKVSVSTSGVTRNPSISIEPKVSIQATRPHPAGQRRRRSGSAASRNGSISSKARGRKIGISVSNDVRGPKRSRQRISASTKPEEKRLRASSSPLAMLGALPMLSSPSSLVDSPLDYIDRPSTDPRTTEYVEPFVQIAGVSSTKQQQQQLLQGKSRRSRVIPCNYSREPTQNESEDKSARSSRLNLDMCDFEDVLSTRSNQQPKAESYTAYLRAMKCGH